MSLFRKSEEEKEILAEKDIVKLRDVLENNTDYKARRAAVRSIKKMGEGANDAAVDALGYTWRHDERSTLRIEANNALEDLKKKGNLRASEELQLLRRLTTWDVVVESLPTYELLGEKGDKGVVRIESGFFTDKKYALKFPQMCVCCGALPVESKREVRVFLGSEGNFQSTTSHHITLSFPCCETCSTHSIKMTKDCTANFSEPVKCFKGWIEADHIFYNLQFTNREYSEAFAKANSGKTVIHL